MFMYIGLDYEYNYGCWYLQGHISGCIGYTNKDIIKLCHGT